MDSANGNGEIHDAFVIPRLLTNAHAKINPVMISLSLRSSTSLNKIDDSYIKSQKILDLKNGTVKGVKCLFSKSDLLVQKKIRKIFYQRGLFWVEFFKIPIKFGTAKRVKRYFFEIGFINTKKKIRKT